MSGYEGPVLAGPARDGDQVVLLDRDIPPARGLRIGKQDTGTVAGGCYAIMVTDPGQEWPSRSVRLAGRIVGSFPAGASAEPYENP